MRWLGIRVRSRTARTSCCCETAATTPLVLANTEVGSMSGVITIDTGARRAVTAATAGRTESAVQHDTKSPATAALTRRALILVGDFAPGRGGGKRGLDR